MIQKVLYDNLHKQVKNYPFHATKTNKIAFPCIVLEKVSITDLPYSQENYTYQEVEGVIDVYDNKPSNKEFLEAVDLIIQKLNDLTKYSNIKDLSISRKVQQAKDHFKCEVLLTFNYINGKL
jgi:DUF4097 and DUF4098 domain-containing protein YvlB